ncbi:MAG: hypothetical protein AAGF31_05750 [Planctomycetota bacterium]
MSFSMLQLALGASFFLVWLFIAGTMLSDRLATIRRSRSGAQLEAATGVLRGPHGRKAQQHGQSPSKRMAAGV